VFRPAILLLIPFLAACALAQQAQPRMRVNMVNVCTPVDADRDEIAAALTRIPVKPTFNPDYEVARGHTTDKAGASDWVRMRREFANDPTLTNVQYQFVLGGDGIQEMLVFYTQGNKPGEPVQISLAQKVTTGTPQQVLAADTPPERITVARFGKPSLVLARCPGIDQKTFEPLFRSAAERFAAYRGALRVKTSVPGELAKLKAGTAARPRTTSAK
jgi:hypothetical protein